MGVKAVIFDLDGVLIHPDFSIFKQARYEIIDYLRNFNLEVRPESPFFKRVYDSLMEAFGDNPSKVHVIYSNVSKIAEKYELRALKSIKLHSEAHYILYQLKQKGYLVGIFSLSGRNYVQHALSLLKCDELVDICVSRDDPIRPKPYPDGIYLICKRLNIKPCECVFIGDTILDAQTALNAQAIPIIVTKDNDYIFEEREKVFLLNKLTLDFLLNILASIKESAGK